MPLKKNKGRGTLRKALAGFAGGASEAALLQAFLGDDEDGGGFEEQLLSGPPAQQLHISGLPDLEEPLEGESLEELLRRLMGQANPSAFPDI